MGVTATSTTGARGDVPASTRSTSEIALRDPPASRPQVFFNPRLPLTKLWLQFFNEVEAESI